MNLRPCSSIGRAPACHAGGSRIETGQGRHHKYWMRLLEFAIPEFRLSESDTAAILAVQESDWRAIDLAEGPNDVQVMTCPLFDNTLERHRSKIEQKLILFIQYKKDNPLKSFGKVDYPFTGDGPLHGIQHAHLTHDISVFYNLVGRDPRQLRLYGVFTHDESGTGRPGRINLQRQLKTRIDQQPFKSA